MHGQPQSRDFSSGYKFQLQSSKAKLKARQLVRNCTAQKGLQWWIHNPALYLQVLDLRSLIFQCILQWGTWLFKSHSKSLTVWLLFLFSCSQVCSSHLQFFTVFICCLLSILLMPCQMMCVDRRYSTWTHAFVLDLLLFVINLTYAMPNDVCGQKGTAHELTYLSLIFCLIFS